MDFQFCQPKFGALPVLHYYPESKSDHHKGVYRDAQDAAGIKTFQPLYMTWESHA